jgi:hypothetical protein
VASKGVTLFPLDERFMPSKTPVVHRSARMWEGSKLIFLYPQQRQKR